MADRKHLHLAALIGVMPLPAFAGAPYATDDPIPTDRGHWEIYAYGTRDGAGGEYQGTYGLDVSYGLTNRAQLAAVLPMAYANGTGSAFGNVEVGVKYRIIHNERTGFDLAVFPRIFLPTAGKGLGTGRASFLLPVWAQKSFGKWAVFGGGGYTINPGVGQRDFALGSIALTRQLSNRMSLGIEASRTGPDADDARASTSVGVGASIKLNDTLSLLASGGPVFEDGSSRAQYRVYTAVEFAF